MKPTHILAIDPGLQGAFALLNAAARKIEMIWDMPVANGQVSPEGVAEIVEMAKFAVGPAPQSLRAVVENVSSRPGQAHAFSFGLSTGIIHGCLGSAQVPFTLVAPSQWKPAMGLQRMANETQAATKTRARILAMKLWPERVADFSKVKFDGRAEAALIGRFWITKNV